MKDPAYQRFALALSNRFTELVNSKTVFTTDIDPEQLWLVYLSSFPTTARRQRHNCNTCRAFIQRFGALALVTEFGDTVSPVWDETLAYDAEMAAPLHAMRKLVEHAKVTGIFVSDQLTLGVPNTDTKEFWSHFYVNNPNRHTRRDKAAHEVAAEKLEDYKNVMRAISEFKSNVLTDAKRLIDSDPTKYSVVRAQIDFLTAVKNAEGVNERWALIGPAPAGFCHPRASMVGTLLEDLDSGLSYEDAATKFSAKMAPLKYQRPQAAPKEGNIQQAEKLFEQLGLAPALQRRMARVEELVPYFLWTPSEPKGSQASGGVFAHLRAEGKTETGRTLPTQTMTWEKFYRTVAANAAKIEQNVPRHGSFIGITTAVNPEAPPLWQWDHPFAWYVQPNGSPASRWSIMSGWRQVVGIVRLPARMGDMTNRFAHHGDGAVLLLEGARETTSGQACIFPSLLRSELHGVRSVIERYSNLGRREGLAEGSACGYDLRDSSCSCELRVTDKNGGVALYKIDRWD